MLRPADRTGLTVRDESTAVYGLPSPAEFADRLALPPGVVADEGRGGEAGNDRRVQVPVIQIRRCAPAREASSREPIPARRVDKPLLFPNADTRGLSTLRRKIRAPRGPGEREHLWMLFLSPGAVGRTGADRLSEGGPGSLADPGCCLEVAGHQARGRRPEFSG